MHIGNRGANNRLVNLNKKNDKALAKSLKKVASGMKVHSAQEDIAGYAIAKRLSVLVRSLDQASENTKTARRVVMTAEGAIQEVINNLRSMKEMAIDAANDHNSEFDRQVLNKAYQQRMETINEIAGNTHYNGKVLLTGNYNTADDPEGLKWSEGFSAYAGCTNRGIKESTSTQGGYRTAVTNVLNQYGVTYIRPAPVNNIGGKYPVNASFNGGGDPSFSRLIPNNTGSRSMGVKIDFSDIKVGGSIPASLHHTGFTIFCGGCNQCVSFRFDAQKTAEESEIIGHDNAEAVIYTIGIAGVTSLDDLATDLFRGLEHAQTVDDDDVRPHSGTPAGETEYISLDTHHNVGIARVGEDIIMLKDGGLSMDIFDHSIVDVREPAPPRSLEMQIGAKSGQSMQVHINALFTANMLLDGTMLTTQKRANATIAALDGAISYALEEASRMGSYRSRLEQTESNLKISSDNTTFSQSQIEDADMAKEMTEYAKNDVLLNCSQAMLSQANHNTGNIISLLQ